jgi:hypothetical protein
LNLRFNYQTFSTKTKIGQLNPKPILAEMLAKSSFENIEMPIGRAEMR